jgi:hypothetical protein
VQYSTVRSKGTFCPSQHKSGDILIHQSLLSSPLLSPLPSSPPRAYTSALIIRLPRKTIHNPESIPQSTTYCTVQSPLSPAPAFPVKQCRTGPPSPSHPSLCSLHPAEHLQTTWPQQKDTVMVSSYCPGLYCTVPQTRPGSGVLGSLWHNISDCAANGGVHRQITAGIGGR